MNFLQRLHPDHGLERGAARPDIASLFAARMAPVAALGEPPRSPAAVPMPAAAPGDRPVPATAIAAAQSLLPVPAPPAVPPPLSVLVKAETAAAPAMSPRDVPAPTGQASSPSATLAAPGVERLIERQQHHTVISRLEAGTDSTAATSTNIPPARTIAPSRPAAGPTPTSAPLRAQTLQRAPAAAAPTVIQVSIDRLDVRLPAERAAASTAASRRAARPAAPGPSLGDYLRGKGDGA